MNVTIKSANCVVVDSGLVTAFDENPIEITLLTDDKNKFTLKFVFNKDEKISGHNLSASSTEDSVTFFLTNFTNPLGTGTSKPLNFATDSLGKKLYINFYVYTIGQSNSTLHYTIYKES